MQPPPPPETGSEPYPVRNWAFFPGIYHQYGRHALGGEVTALYRGVGVAAGFEPEARYLEAEVAVYAVSFGIGPRFNAAGVAPQWTIAIPLTPVIPYFRTIGAKTDHRGEFGLMLKFPFFDLSHVQGVL